MSSAEKKCGVCAATPARGHAEINGTWYCHEGPSPTCYEVTENFPEIVEREIRRLAPALNRLETHLGCVLCHGPLTDGVCRSCHPSD